MNQSIVISYMPLIVSIITILGGGVIYILQKRLDRFERLQSDRIRLYSEYLASLQVVTSATTDFIVDQASIPNYLAKTREHYILTSQVNLYSSERTRASINTLESLFNTWRMKCTAASKIEEAEAEFKTYLKQKNTVEDSMRAELHDMKPNWSLTARRSWLRRTKK